MTEADVCRNFVLPSIYKAGWDNTRIREQFSYTAGRIEITNNRTKRGDAKRADYILFYKSHLPLAVIEAKDEKHSAFDGIEQAIGYAKDLDVPFAYSTNGKAYVEHDLTTGIEREIKMNELPSPEDLYIRWLKFKGLLPTEEKVVLANYYSSSQTYEPRYFQRNAINRVCEAVARDQKRIMLVMATGTGKTLVAFNIIHKLWKNKTKKRILFLADRNILVDQARDNEFVPFGEAMVKVTGKSNISTLKSHEIFLSLYQALSGQSDPGTSEFDQENDVKDLYKQFSPDFFDLIVVDECHRGSAKEDSAWRDILTYFKSATQLGMTATPKNTLDAGKYEYFGEPVYTYSLKQGIDDGFLAPYRVINYTIDLDAEGYRPETGKVDKYGNLVEDRIYNSSDFDRKIVIEKRTKLVAQELTEYLKATDRYAKTIVFCQDTEHAAMMRSYLQTLNTDIGNTKYVVRITGNETHADLDENLYDFLDVNSEFPVIATTSKLLTTGVNTQSVKVIVLDANIRSLSEFKQIIGRGTRIREVVDKKFFTILDFRKATNLFADPDFDGEPVKTITKPSTESIEDVLAEVEADNKNRESDVHATEDSETRTDGKPMINIDWGKGTQVSEPKKYYLDDVDASVISRRGMVLDSQGKLVNAELLARKNIKEKYQSMNDFIQKWNDEDKRSSIIEELRQHGVYLHEIYEDYRSKHKQDIDFFDLILFLAFDRPPLSR